MQPRLRAFLVHLSASAFVLAVFTAIVLFWWYPGPLLALQGGGSVLLMLLTVDVILGPSLTGFVYKPGKKWLVLDLTVIVAVQLAALSYGAISIYVQRPNYLAFTLDRFFLVSTMDTVGELPAGGDFPTWRGNVRLATAPVTSETTSASLGELEHVSADNLIPPLAIMAAEVSNYPPADRESAVRRGKAMGDIDDAAVRQTALARLNGLGIAPKTVRAYRVVGRKGVATALVRIQDGQVIDIVR